MKRKTAILGVALLITLVGSCVVCNGQQNLDLPKTQTWINEYEYQRLPIKEVIPCDTCDMTGRLVAYRFRHPYTGRRAFTAFPIECRAYGKREGDERDSYAVYIEDTTYSRTDTVSFALWATYQDSAWKYCQDCLRVWRRSTPNLPPDETMTLYTNIANPLLIEYDQGSDENGNCSEEARLKLLELWIEKP